MPQGTIPCLLRALSLFLPGQSGRRLPFLHLLCFQPSSSKHSLLALFSLESGLEKVLRKDVTLISLIFSVGQERAIRLVVGSEGSSQILTVSVSSSTSAVKENTVNRNATI